MRMSWSPGKGLSLESSASLSRCPTRPANSSNSPDKMAEASTYGFPRTGLVVNTAASSRSSCSDDTCDADILSINFPCKGLVVNTGVASRASASCYSISSSSADTASTGLPLRGLVVNRAVWSPVSVDGSSIDDSVQRSLMYPELPLTGLYANTADLDIPSSGTLAKISQATP